MGCNDSYDDEPDPNLDKNGKHWREFVVPIDCFVEKGAVTAHRTQALDNPMSYSTTLEVRCSSQPLYLHVLGSLQFERGDRLRVYLALVKRNGFRESFEWQERGRMKEMESPLKIEKLVGDDVVFTYERHVEYFDLI